MKNRNYVHKTITLTYNHCKIKVRVKKNYLFVRSLFIYLPKDIYNYSHPNYSLMFFQKR